MKVIRKKFRATKIIVFAFAGLLSLGIISIINQNNAQAINGELDYLHRVATGGFGSGTSGTTIVPKLNKSVNLNITNHESVVTVGKEVDSGKTRGLVVTHENTSSGAQLNWHVTESLVKEFFDVAQLGNYIVAVGASQDDMGYIVAYDLNGNRVDYFPNHEDPLDAFEVGTYSLVSPIGSSETSFRAANDKVLYAFGINENGDITRVGGGNSQNDKIIYINEDYTVTTREIIHSNPYWTVTLESGEGDFVTAESTFGHIYTLQGSNNIKSFDSDDGSKDYEITVPDATIYQLSNPSRTNDGGIFAIGKETTRCDIGGLYNQNNVVFSISDGTIMSDAGVLWEKSIYYATGSNTSFSTVSGAHTYGYGLNYAVVGLNDKNNMLQATFYNEKYADPTTGKATVNYVVDNQAGVTGVTNCGATDLEKGTKFYPKTPSVTGYTFNGWYTDQSYTNKYTDGTEINSDTTLYASWSRAVYNVTFEWGFPRPDGVQPPATQSITHGETAVKPQNPSAAGYNWNGWHQDSCANPEFGFSTPITKNTRLIGCWGLNENTISFVAVSTDNPSSYLPNNAFDSRTVSYDSSLVDLPHPSAKGDDSMVYTFDGWYTSYDEQNGLSNPFEPIPCYEGDEEPNCIDVKSDITLYGAWINHTLYVTDDGEGGIKIVGPDAGSNAYIDQDGNLVLDGLDNHAGLKIETEKDVTIVLENDNVTGCITSENSTVTITGAGSLTALCIDGQDVVIDSVDNLVAVTIDADNTISINDSNVSTFVMHSDQGDITVEGTTLSIDDAIISSQGDILIKDSTVSDLGDDDLIIITDQGNIVIDNSEVSTQQLSATGGDISIINDSQVSVDQSLYTNRLNVADSNLNLSVDSAGEHIYIAAGIFEEGDSNINIKANRGGLTSPVLSIKDGDFKISSDDPGEYVLNTYYTEIDSGSLTVEGDSDNTCQVISLFSHFNGGTTKMSSNSSIALCTDLTGALGGNLPISDEVIPYIVEQVNSELDAGLVAGEHIVFNGGDTTMKAKVGSAVVNAPTDDAADGTIIVKKDLVIDPDNVEFSLISTDNEHAYAFSYGKTYVGEDGVVVNLANYVRVHEYVPVPDSDEEVPDTVDFQIIGLAGAVFISLMVEGMIIADLYRRLHGYEEEIAAETVNENIMISNEPVYPAQVQNENVQTINDIKPVEKNIPTEESPAEEVTVKFNKSNDVDDYNGPGDEYYY